MTSPSQLTNYIEIQKPVSKYELSELAESGSEAHKEGCTEATSNLTNRANNNCPLPISKDTHPREPVSVDFAVDQWFRILLVQMQKQSVSLLDDLAVPFEAKTGNINI